MALEQDTLNTLIRIEKILSDSNRSISGGTTRSGNTSRYDSSAARAEESQIQHTKKITVSTGKAVERLGAVSYKSAERLVEFTRKTNAAGIGLDGLTSVVTKSIAQINAQRSDLGKIDMSTTLSALQTAVADATASIKSSNLAKGDITGFANTIGTLDDLIDNKVNPRLGSFNSALHLASQSLIGLWGDLREQRRDGGAEMKEFAKGIGAASSALSRKQGVGEYFDKFILQLRKANVALRELRTGARSGGGSGGGEGSGEGGGSNEQNNARKNLTSTFVSNFTDTIKAAAVAAAARVMSSAVKVIDEAFQTTAARGFGTFSSTFLELSGDAAAAGMSLKEYTQMMDKNEGLLSRSSSFEGFQKQLDVGRDGLAKFGVFGKEATNLSVAMAGSAQTLGVPIEDLTKSMEGRMGVFEQLRKTTGITADQFAELNRNLQNNDDVQRELIGLAPEERAARITQLQETSSMGRAFGLTEQQSSKLAAALLAQRKTTVKERFNAAGRLRQTMSLVGMDPAEIAEAATLAGKRMKTPEEEQRYMDLLGKYASRAEEIKQNAGPGMANAVESSEELLTPGVQESLAASVALRVAKQSGAQNNKDINKSNEEKALSALEQFIGKSMGVLEGIGENSIAQLVIATAGFAGLSIATWLNTKATAANTAALLTSKGLSSPSGLDGPDGKGKGKLGRMAGNMRGIAKGSIVGSVIGLGFAAADYSNAEEASKVENGGDGDVSKLKGEAIGTGLGSVAGGIIGAAIGSIIPGIGTIIVGTLGSMLGGFVGKMIGGFIGSENATEKNSRETAKLSKEMIEARRATAGTDVISTGNLSSVASNVLQTGQARAANTVGQEKAIQATINKKNSTTQSLNAPQMEEYDITDPMSGVVIGTGIREKSRQSATATQATIQSIATPTSITPTRVNQDTVNTTTAATTAASAVSAASTTITSALPIIDQTSALAEILKVLQQSLMAETSQVELTTQLLQRTNSGRLIDTNVLMKRVG